VSKNRTPQHLDVPTLVQAREWVNDAFFDVSESRKKVGNLQPLERADAALTTIKTLIDQAMVEEMS